MRILRAIGTVVLCLLGLLLVIFAVANRESVTLSLDPFSSEAPALAVSMPLFLLIFLCLALGVIIGALADWIRQGYWRREARAARTEADALKYALQAQAPRQSAGDRPHETLPTLR